MTLNPIDEIVRFQTDRDLDKKEFDVYNENTNIVEELLESHGLDIPKERRSRLKRAWISFVALTEGFEHTRLYRKEAVADAYCDVIVFAVGALLKLGYDPTKALAEAAKEINSREGSMVDGKFEKDLSDEAKAKWYKADFNTCKR